MDSKIVLLIIIFGFQFSPFNVIGHQINTEDSILVVNIEQEDMVGSSQKTYRLNLA